MVCREERRRVSVIRGWIRRKENIQIMVVDRGSSIHFPRIDGFKYLEVFNVLHDVVTYFVYSIKCYIKVRYTVFKTHNHHVWNEILYSLLFMGCVWIRNRLA